MADLKISQLPEVTIPSSGDAIPVVNSETTKKVTVANLLAQGYQGTDVRALTSKYDAASTLVQSNSSNWDKAYNISTQYSQTSSTFLTKETQLQSLSGNWQSTYTTVQSNSAQWASNIDTGVRSLTSNWESTYTTFKNVSSTFLTSETDAQTLSFNESNKNLSISNGNTVSLSALVDNGNIGKDTEVRDLTANWQSTYTTVQSNSAQWASNIDTGVRALTGNWESTYTTFKNVSSTFLTSETDSQTLSFNENTKDLSISNGNTVSLSALIDTTSIDTGVRSLTSNWENTYTTVQGNSAQWASNIDTGIRSLTSNWQNTYDNAVFAVSGTLNQIVSTKTTSSPGNNTYTLSLPNSAVFPGDVYITGNLTAAGSATYLNTQNLVVDDSLIYLARSNSFNILDIGLVAHFTQSPLGFQHTGLVRKSGQGNPGVWTLFSGLTTEPLTGTNLDWDDKNLTLDSLSANIITPNGNSDQWNNVYTQVQSNSAQWSSTTDTELRPLTGNWESTYTTVQSNSGQWASNIDTGVRSLTSNWESTYTSYSSNSGSYATNSLVNNISSQLVLTSDFSNYKTDVASATATFLPTTIYQNASGNWESTYTTFRNVSSTFLTSETDSQTLSYNEGTQELSISNGNTISLSALTDLTSVDSAVRSLTSNWESTYTTVQSNSAQWASNIDTGVRSLTSNWDKAYEISSAYSLVSSTFLTSETDSQTLSFNETTKDLSISNGNTISLSALTDLTSIDTEVRSLTSNWESTYTTVQSNSGQWASNVDTDVRALTSNWESTYTTFKNVSSTFLTSETDSQTLSFNEGTKDLSISNGNTVSLSAFGTGADTEVRALTSNWQSTYTTVLNNSATTWNYQGTDLKALSGNWQSTYTTYSANSSTYIKTVATTTPGTSAVSTIVAVSALPVSPDPNTLYIVI